MDRDQQVKRIAYMLATLGLAFVVISTMVGGEKAKKAELDLKNRFDVISPFSGAEQYDYSPTVKAGLVDFRWFYKTEVPFDDVYSYYKKELTNHDWKFDKKIENPDGSINFYFKQGNYSAVLTRIDKYDYSLTLRWAMLGY